MRPVLRLVLTGHLTENSLEGALLKLASEMAAVPPPAGTGAAPQPAKHRVLVDCLAMTSYDSEARSRFIRWGRESVQRLDRVAILTTNTLWHMIIRAMALASGVQMRPFAQSADAQTWLTED